MISYYSEKLKGLYLRYNPQIGFLDEIKYENCYKHKSFISQLKFIVKSQYFSVEMEALQFNRNPFCVNPNPKQNTKAIMKTLISICSSVP